MMLSAFGDFVMMSASGDIVRIQTPADLGLTIRERRKLLGLDQQALAERVGVSRQWIVEIEKGKPRAEIGLLLRTLRELGLVLEANTNPPTGPGKRAPAKSQAPDLDAIVERFRGKPG